MGPDPTDRRRALQRGAPSSGSQPSAVSARNALRRVGTPPSRRRPRGRSPRSSLPRRARHALAGRRSVRRSSASRPSACAGRGGPARAGASSAAVASISAPAREVDQLAVHPVADRPPEVLLDLAVAERGAEHALVVVERRLGDAGDDQRRRAGTTRRRGSAHRRSAPRPCRTRGVAARSTRAASTRRSEPVAVEQLDEVGVAGPVAERLVDPAAREGPGEDLGADRVQAGVAADRGRASSPRRRAAAAAGRAGGRRPRSPGRRRARRRARAGSRCCCAARPSRGRRCSRW